MNRSSTRFVKWRNIGLVSLMLLSVGVQTSPAFALPATGTATSTPSQKVIDCLGDLHGTLSATPQLIPFGQTATLRWNVTVPRSCTGIGVKLYVDNQVAWLLLPFVSTFPSLTPIFPFVRTRRMGTPTATASTTARKTVS
jgi:hypothetical protein